MASILVELSSHKSRNTILRKKGKARCCRYFFSTNNLLLSTVPVFLLILAKTATSAFEITASDFLFIQNSPRKRLPLCTTIECRNRNEMSLRRINRRKKCIRTTSTNLYSVDGNNGSKNNNFISSKNILGSNESGDNRVEDGPKHQNRRDNNNISMNTNSGDIVRVEKSSGLLRLAELSLRDYEWRNGFFKKSEADRRVEESLARMMGDEASYVRPMDASEDNIGPLGLWEKTSVEWLRQVIDEEARRAKEIVRLGGILVRPMDAYDQDEKLGPLGIVERRFVDLLENIRTSERERTRVRVLRPKDLDESVRGPLGEAELRASETIREILNSEKMRMEQSIKREKVVQPIDIPGPLGELEMAVLDVVKAEEQRKLESEQNAGSAIIRPMNARQKGPLGELEEQAIDAVRRLTDEEKMRLRNIQRYLDEMRPMQQAEPSALKLFETIVVGIVRAPILIYQIFCRVRDLLQLEKINEADSKILREEKEHDDQEK